MTSPNIAAVWKPERAIERAATQGISKVRMAVRGTKGNSEVYKGIVKRAKPDFPDSNVHIWSGMPEVVGKLVDDVQERVRPLSIIFLAEATRVRRSTTCLNGMAVLRRDIEETRGDIDAIIPIVVVDMDVAHTLEEIRPGVFSEPNLRMPEEVKESARHLGLITIATKQDSLMRDVERVLGQLFQGVDPRLSLR